MNWKLQNCTETSNANDFQSPANLVYMNVFLILSRTENVADVHNVRVHSDWFLRGYRKGPVA